MRIERFHSNLYTVQRIVCADRQCVYVENEDEFDLETYRKSLEAYKTLPSSYTLDEVESEILNPSR